MQNDRAGKSAARRGLILRVAIAVVAIIAAMFFVPRAAVRIFLSADDLGQMLRDEATKRGGLQLDFSNPRLSLWPRPRLKLTDPVLRRADGSVLAEAAILTADMPLFAGFLPEPRFTAIDLGLPRVYLRGLDTGRWAKGLPAEITNFATLFDPAALDMLSNVHGTFRVDGGSVFLQGEALPRLAEVKARLAWPSEGTPLSLSASGTINGKGVRLDLNSSGFRRLISGEEAPVQMAISLPGASAEIDGTANLSRLGFLSGAFTLTASDVQTLLDWSGTGLSGMETVKTASLTASLGSYGRTLRFDTMALAINDTRASGFLELALPETGTPKASGTLAFDEFDIDDINTLKPLAERFFARDEQGVARPAAMLDLRVSSRSADIGSVRLDDIAASMIVGKEHALIDIGDSSFAGGRLTGRVSTGSKGLGEGLRLQASMRGVDVAQVAGDMILGQLWPKSGVGDADINLTLEGPPEDALLQRKISGKASIRIDQGSLTYFSSTGLAALGTATPLPAPLSSSKDSFSFDKLDMDLELTHGLMGVTLMAQSSRNRLSLTGRETARGTDFELSGTVGPVATPDVGTRFSLAGPVHALSVTALTPPNP